MSRTFETLHDILAHGADTVIDVRSPAEFALDHIPGAINLPALTNAQRADIGTTYVQDSAFKARKRGAALVARNVADHLEGPLSDMDGSWQPLVYCWRGGQRSGSFTSILQQIGWRAETISGGYQSYRRLVNQYLYDAPLSHRIILLDGNTGTGKTEILARLKTREIQTIDLEALANHRGSLFGGMSGGQPAQRGFETALASALVGFDPTRPVIMEAESSKIGKINLPKGVWASMCAAPRIMVTASVQDRAAYLAKTYKDIATDPDAIRNRLQPLRYVRGHAMVDGWEALLDAGELNTLAATLMQHHYDAAYAKSRKTEDRSLLETIALANLEADGIDAATDQIATLLNRLA